MGFIPTRTTPPPVPPVRPKWFYKCPKCKEVAEGPNIFEITEFLVCEWCSELFKRPIVRTITKSPYQ